MLTSLKFGFKLFRVEFVQCCLNWQRFEFFFMFFLFCLNFWLSIEVVSWKPNFLFKLIFICLIVIANCLEKGCLTETSAIKVCIPFQANFNQNIFPWSIYFKHLTLQLFNIGIMLILYKLYVNPTKTLFSLNHKQI